TYVSKLDFKILDESEIDASKEKNFKLDFSTSFGEIKNQFAIIFDIEISNPERYNMQIKYDAIFQADTDLTDEFKESHFVTANAPAIAFPFLRSFVSTLIVNAGHGSLILPSINFTNYKKK
ncbi:MAG TPA: protein-export chaperone SecB, partial [Leptospiraceae bacterium]|nr:protein-export chaperone SecB [Leptospiraceae bacterium]